MINAPQALELTQNLKQANSSKVTADLLKENQGNPKTTEAIHQKFYVNFISGS